jgi:hypothetical protein
VELISGVEALVKRNAAHQESSVAKGSINIKYSHAGK